MSQSQPDGYLAMPTAGNGSAGKGNPVLVLHAWWGLNDTIKAFCNRLAEAGFVAFAADLYHGKVAKTIADAETLGATVDGNVDQATADIIAAVTFLKARAGSGESGITVIAFSLGAYYALNLSINAPETVQSVILFYGTCGTVPLDFSKSKAEYLGHFAENDVYETPALVDHLEESLRSAGRPVTFYRYPGTAHWFFEPDVTEAYDAAAASLAWERTLAFLRRST